MARPKKDLDICGMKKAYRWFEAHCTNPVVLKVYKLEYRMGSKALAKLALKELQEQGCIRREGASIYLLKEPA